MNLLHRLSLADVARENLRGWPQHLAVVDGDHRLTYAELGDRTNRLANILIGEGIEAGDRIIWIGRNSFRILELIIASAKVGAVMCVANWRQTEDELEWMLEDWSPSLVFCETLGPEEGSLIPHLREGSPATWIECERSGHDSYEERVSAASAIDPELPVDPASGLIALYTGAFDGKPQAAVLSHDAIIAHDLVVALQSGMRPGEFTYLACGPLFHVGTMMWLTATFHLGGTNVFMTKFDAEHACRLIEAERVNSMLAIPAMLDELARTNADDRYDLSSLTVAPSSPEVAKMVTPDTSPWGRSPGGYGQTEVGGMMTYAGIGGRTSPLMHVRIVDTAGAEVPTGEVGEIVTRGLHVMNGYHDRPELNRSRQRDDWYHTGDLGRREADGAVTFIGPMRRMIKSGAENIYVAEVEQALQKHEEIADVAVIGVPDEKWDQRVKAIVVRTPDSILDEDAVVLHARSLIASYKKPKEVAFVESIPRNGFAVDYDTLDAQHGGGGYPGSH